MVAEMLRLWMRRCIFVDRKRKFVENGIHEMDFCGMSAISRDYQAFNGEARKKHRQLVSFNPSFASVNMTLIHVVQFKFLPSVDESVRREVRNSFILSRNIADEQQCRQATACSNSKTDASIQRTRNRI